MTVLVERLRKAGGRTRRKETTQQNRNMSGLNSQGTKISCLGVAALPLSVFVGVVLGAGVGAAVANIGMGVAIGAGFGVGVGVCVTVAVFVFR